MRILFVNPVGAMGGAERAMLTCIKALTEIEQEPIEIYLLMGTEGSLQTVAETLGVTVKILKFPQAVNKLGDSALKGKNPVIAITGLLLKLIPTVPQIFLYAWQLKQIIREINPHLLHSNGLKTHLLTAMARPDNIPLVWHLHDFYGSRPLMAKLLRWASIRTELGIAISQAVAKDTKETMPHLPVQVIYNAIDINHFSPVAPVPHYPLRVGLVATFARWKGHDIFLQAIAILQRTRPELEANFYIVGGPIYVTQGSQFSQEELENQAQQLGITDRITFLGFQANVVETYRWLDIVVHASTQPEPFGLAIIEAMACGKPMIVAQAGGAAELFTQDHDAVGVPPGDPQALATAIGNLLQDEEKRQSLGKKARKTVMEKFSHQRLGRQFLISYEKVIK